MYWIRSIYELELQWVHLYYLARVIHLFGQIGNRFDIIDALQYSPADGVSQLSLLLQPADHHLAWLVRLHWLHLD